MDTVEEVQAARIAHAEAAVDFWMAQVATHNDGVSQSQLLQAKRNLGEIRDGFASLKVRMEFTRRIVNPSLHGETPKL